MYCMMAVLTSLTVCVCVCACAQVLPLKRCVSHKATLTGEYNAQKKGVYVLKFDNRHSK